MMRRRGLLLKILIGLGLGGGLFGTARAAPAAPATPEQSHVLEVLGQAIAIVKKQYVKPVDNSQLIKGAMTGLLQSLDPNSIYISPITYAIEVGHIPADQSASIGLTMTRDGDDIHVLNTLDGTPAAKADIQAGDTIIAIDGKYPGNSLEAAAALFRGAPGTPLTLTLGRRHQPNVEVHLIREKIFYHNPIKSEFMDGIGVLSIRELNSTTEQELRAALAKLLSGPPAVRGFVFDLRGCPGGLLETAVAVSSVVLNGQEILSNRGASPTEVEHFRAKGKDQIKGLPLVVLIDAGTGSGCEVIAAALQDNGRAKIVGMPSLGSGSVQVLIPLNSGQDGAIKLTVAFMYRPSGRPIQKLGVIPDLVVAKTREDADRLANCGYQFSEASYGDALDAESAGPRPLPASAEAPPTGFSGDFQLHRALEMLTNSKP
jgi:carboxyl-terminal processing protease